VAAEVAREAVATPQGVYIVFTRRARLLALMRGMLLLVNLIAKDMLFTEELLSCVRCGKAAYVKYYGIWDCGP